MLYWCKAENVMLCLVSTKTHKVCMKIKIFISLPAQTCNFYRNVWRIKSFQTLSSNLHYLLSCKNKTYLKIPKLLNFEKFWKDWNTRLCRITTKMCMKWCCYVEIVHEIFQRRLTLQSATGTHVSTAVYWFRYISGVWSFITTTMLMESE